MPSRPPSLPRPARELVGRDTELRLVSEALATTGTLRAAVLLEGEAGIGKTALWRAAIAEREARGARVLSVEPGEAETGLSYAGLSDLLGPALDELRPALPPPQRRALDVALLRAEPGEQPIDPRAVGAATVGVLAAAAAVGPVLVAIDDVQWLDSASAAAVGFALRRLGDTPLGVVATRRVEGDAQPGVLGLPLELVSRVQVKALGVDALREVMRREVGDRLSGPGLARLAEVAGGNPYYALELARASVRDGGSGRGRAGLRIPEQLSNVLRGRLQAFASETREALGTVAAIGDATVASVAAAVDADALEPAFAAGVLREDGRTIRFDHPLLAEAAYRALSPARRRAAHERLAGLAADPEERARHLTAIASRQDSATGAAIAAGAEAAAARGAAAAAAELLEAAASVEPEGDVSARRRLAAVRRHMGAGDGRRARALTEELLAELPAGPLRSRVWAVRAELQGSLGEQLEAAQHAVKEAGDDLEALVEALLIEAFLLVLALRLREASERVERAERHCGHVADRRLRVRVMTMHGDMAATYGQEGAVELLEAAAELEGDDLIPDAYLGPRTTLARALLWADELDAARALLEERERRAAEAGDDEARAGILLHLTELECRSGRLDQARHHAEEGLAILEASYGEFAQASLSYGRALVAAYQGEVELARELARSGLAQAEAQGDELFAMENRVTLGFLALSLGDHEEAADWLGPIPAQLAEAGMDEPGKPVCHADAIESLIGAGHLAEAEELLVSWEATGRRLNRPRVHATAARCRALLAGARGELEAAIRHAEAAMAHHEYLPDPLELARTQMVLGTVLRRAKRKAAARAALDQALTGFEAIGAPLWAERARAELARIGGRARTAGLTPTQQRVADLVAEGKTNREVADLLFVSVRTVEASLTRIYRELGIRSRTELASRHRAVP